MPPRTSKDLCPKCGTGFWGLHALAMHLKKKHDPCPYCDRAFIRLPMHVRKMHPHAILDEPES